MVWRGGLIGLVAVLLVAVTPAIASAATPTVLTLGAPSSGFVGDSMSLSAQLTDGSGGAIAGATVVFIVTQPDASSVTPTATTDATGAATTAFTPTLRGVHSVQASYAGDTTYSASNSPTASVSVYQRTSLSLGAVSGVAGATTTVAATLTSVPGSAPVAGQFVTFDFAGGVPPAAGVTDGSGVASVTVVFPSAGTFTVTASFLNSAGYYTNHVGAIPPIAEIATSTVTVALAETALSLTAPAFSLVGNTVSISAQLSRVSAPSGPLTGATVTLIVTRPDTSTFTLTATTDSTGTAAAVFTATLRGVHSVQASYAGDAAHEPKSSNTASVTVYQRTSLTMPAASGVAGSPTTITATLTSFPLPGTGVAGQTVTFDFGGVVPAVTGVTNGSGVASVTPVFPSAGTFTVTASFLNSAGYYTNHVGAIPPIAEIATSTVTVGPDPTAETALSLSAPAFGLVGNVSSLSAQLSQVTAPSGPIAGATVVFTVTQPDASTFTATATTDATGAATTTFTFTLRGVHSVQASYAGDATHDPASATASVPAYQRTKVSISAPASSTVNSPFTVAANLTAQPGDVPIAGKTVMFTLTPPAGAPTTLAASTNAAGQATVTFPASAVPTGGNYTVTATFLDSADYYTNHAGAIPPIEEVATSTVLVLADVTPPTVDLRTPVDGGSYGVGTTVIADFDCADTGGSGLASCVGTVSDGAAINTATVGTRTFTVTATDDAGNTATRSVTYKVFSATTLVAQPVVAVRELLRLRISLNLEARLTTSPGGVPLAGRTITFSAGGSILCIGITDTNGIARCTGVIPLLSAVLALGYQANYAGENLYLPSSSTAPIIGI